MTTIAWDGRSIAADRRLTGTGGVATVGKLFRLGGGVIMGGAGHYSQVVEVVAWIKEGANPKKKPEFPEELAESSDLIMVKPDGTCYWLTWPYLRQVKINEPFTAVGSGADYAIGAMAAGADARKAIQIAARFDPYTGGRVDVIKVRG